MHALLGENGAGKSTLSNILTGLYQPDAGTIELWGKAVRFAAPRDSLAAGVSMVHQHFRLVEPFTVAENVLLGDHDGPGASFALHPRAVEQEVAALAERYRLPVQPDARIWQLSVGEQQRVEILKALHRDARILILDEPTAVLTPQEVAALFPTLRQMADEGRTVIFISHKLHEVMAVSDRVTVLRGGRSLGTLATSETTPHALAALMVGRDVAASRREVAQHVIGEPVLQVEGLEADGDRGQRALRDVSLELRAARSWRSPAWRATASASSPRRSRACARARRDTCASRDASCVPAIRATRSAVASPTCPRIASGPACRRA